MRASLCPDATKLMVKSGLAALIHCAHAPLTPSRRASSGTKTMISATPATATRRNRKIARSGFMSPEIATTACSIHRKIGPYGVSESAQVASAPSWNQLDSEEIVST